MMTLADASSFFDRTPALDPANDVVRFMCQLDNFDDSRRDAGGAYRRILSVAPGTVIPASRALRIFGQVWLVGAKQTDGLEDRHREKYVLQPAAGKLGVSRLSGFVEGTVASTLWASVEWAKDTRDLETSSEIPQTHYAYMAAGSDVRERDILHRAGDAFLVMAVHEQPSGYLLANCIQLDRALPLPAQLTTRVYQPALGGYVAGSTVTVNALQVRWRSLYLYGSQADARYQEGDFSLVLPAGTAVTTATQVQFDARTWRVVSSEILSGAVVAQVRPSDPVPSWTTPGQFTTAAGETLVTSDGSIFIVTE